MIGAYVESLKLRVGTFIGMAAVLGYLATIPNDPSLPALTLLFVTTVLAAGGAGALNHFLDRDLDARTPRTAARAPPSGRIRRAWHVVALGIGLVVLAVSAALWWLHPLVGLHVFFGAFTYVVVYTIWLKPRTPYNAVIGGRIKGLIPWATSVPFTYSFSELVRSSKVAAKCVYVPLL